MANQEHLDILKQGVKVWNHWRKEHPEVRPDLIKADLSRSDLTQAYLRFANLAEANLSFANLSFVHLEGADLSRADLSFAHLTEADLTDADLTDADLTEANFTGADLTRANLTGALVGWSIFGNLDLRRVRGLETVNHKGPSTIGIDTIYRSEAHFSEGFLRNAGVPDSFIDYTHSLVIKPIDYYTCFISYSGKDQAFAERLYTDLQSKGVRCWFAPEHMKIGDEIRPRIEESIRVYDKLLLVFSEHAVNSVWVKDEVEAALEKEQQQDTSVLYPIRVDDTIMHATPHGQRLFGVGNISATSPGGSSTTTTSRRLSGCYGI